MSSSVNFDPAAKTYEATRGFPPGIDAEVAAAAAELIGSIAPGLKVLEIGVGTGRIARPLAAHGLPVIGVDLSAGMLAELRRLTPPDAPAPLLTRGDATRLPIAPASCAAVIGVHIFHLIPEWRAALNEIGRILAPGGVLLTGHDWRDEAAPSVRMMQAWRAIVRERGYPTGHPGADDFQVVQRHLAEHGVTADERLVGNWVTRRSVAEMLAGFAQRTWSSTWKVPDEDFDTCLALLRAWAMREIGSIETIVEVPFRFRWQRYAPVGPWA